MLDQTRKELMHDIGRWTGSTAMVESESRLSITHILSAETAPCKGFPGPAQHWVRLHLLAETGNSCHPERSRGVWPRSRVASFAVPDVSITLRFTRHDN